ncbi:hypothetical protein [Variovorax sp. RA8]|uniref:hypothetical protein n=1 Tax=Variovorax sp. (strain JCM 16519 / RA8) TaxID=662548 RepID=UPI0013192F65|nr:hypothetical protein [Variovorax sp. RA8]VTU22427.1 hypothetical protein RA8CHR_02530 [Variovorax sp. RA8]
MANTTVAQSPATATRRAPRLVFRPANARRPFRRGDLALHAGSIVVVCMSEHDHGDLDAELPVRTTRGVVGNARAKSLRLLAGVDTQEFGPGYHDLLKFIADAAAAR